MFRGIIFILLLGCFFIVSAQETNSLKKSEIKLDPPEFSSTANQIHFTKTESSFPLIALGEVRKVSTLESFYVWESFVNGGKVDLAPEINDEERVRIIRNIASERPNLLVLLGDMVHYGAKEHNWDYFDEIFRPVMNKKIPMYAILGEHEYWGRNSLSKKYIYDRFPVLGKSSWYSKKSDGIMMIFLNSNKSEMSEPEWESQQIWFEKQIISCDEDPEIRGLVVFVHHSPYTNSEKGESSDVKSTFLPRFVAAKKTMLMITGSAATYERFDKYGKTFIVTGGGGAPRDELEWDENAHKDEYRRHLPVDGNRVRPFNFVELNVAEQGLSVKVMGLNKGNVNFFVMEEFVITFPGTHEKQAALDE